MNNATDASIWGIELGTICSYAACEGVAPVRQWMPMDPASIRQHKLVSLFGCLYQALSAAAGRAMSQNVVVAVPAVLSLQQRQLVANAAKEAGLKVVRFLNHSEGVALSRISVGAAPEGDIAVAVVGDGYVETAVFEWKDDVLEGYAVTTEKFAHNQGLAAEFLVDGALFRTAPLASEIARGETDKTPSYLVYYADTTALPFAAQTAMPLCWDSLPRVTAAEGAAAIGAVYFGSIIRGESGSLVLQLIAGGLGLEAGDGSMISLLEGNTTIPTIEVQEFDLQPGQTMFGVHLLEGNGLRAEDCESMGWYTLDGLIVAGPQAEKIKVTLEIDALSNVDLTLCHAEADKSRTWRVAELASAYVRPREEAPAPAEPSNPEFTLSGNDAYLNEAIELTRVQAVEGCVCQVPTPLGKTESVAVPGGLAEGVWTRAQGLGPVAADGTRGDLYFWMRFV